MFENVCVSIFQHVPFLKFDYFIIMINMYDRERNYNSEYIFGVYVRA